MPLIPTRVHGAIDYLVGLLLIASPSLFGFAEGGAAQAVPQLVGAATILMSLLTRYEWGAVRVIPFPVHLGIDLATALLLLASPWLFGFADVVRWPHVGIALAELGVIALSARQSPVAARRAA